MFEFLAVLAHVRSQNLKLDHHGESAGGAS